MTSGTNGIPLTRDEISKIVDGSPRGIEFFDRLNSLVQRFFDPPWARRDEISDLEFVRIPVWAKEIRMTFSGLSVATADDFLVQLGYTDPTSGAVVWYTADYTNACSIMTASAVTTSENTAGFFVRLGTTDNMNGIMNIFRIPTREPNAARWCYGHNMRAGPDRLSVGGGRIIVDQVVDRVRVISAGGAILDGGLVGMEAFP